MLERESSWSWSLSTRYIQFHSNQLLVSPCRPPDPVKDIYNVQTCDLKAIVDIWTMMDMLPVEYGTFAHKFHLAMCFFLFITGITFNWYYVLWHIIALLV